MFSVLSAVEPLPWSTLVATGHPVEAKVVTAAGEACLVA